MNLSTKRTSFEELALRYKTIGKKQLEYARAILSRKRKNNPDITMETILIEEGFATKEQINILNLILDFLQLKEKSKKFGSIAVKMGFATQQDVDNALQKQHMAFKKSKIKKTIGNILVDSKIITPAEKNAIIAEQAKLSSKKRSVASKNKQKNEKKNEYAPETANKQKLQKKQEIQEAHVPITPSGNPDVDIIISEDSMEAWVKLPDDTSRKITLEKIKNEIHKKGIKFGIYNNSLLQSKINAEKKFFLAARGQFPAVHKNKLIKYLFNNGHETDLISGSDPLEKSEDFIRTEKTDLVRKGKTIARLDAGDTDSNGRDLFGRRIDELFYGDHAPHVFRCGRGAVASHDDIKAFAGRSGYPFLSIEKKLYVLSFINILEDADLKFGPIEDFSNINVKGTLTGAFPVKAGGIKAREIRETRLYALKDIAAEIGITNARIITQGNVHARYIHNSTIEAFGDVIVEHEIIDSTIICSGKCKAVKSRIIASKISAKQGIICAGAGSDPTEACILMAGREDHIINEADRIEETIELIKKEMTDLEKKKDIIKSQINNVFKKMTDLKLFYDRAKKEMSEIDNAPGKDFSISDKDSYIKTMELRDNLDKKMASIINSLKGLNNKKSAMEIKKHDIVKQIKKIKPIIEKKIIEKKIDMENLFQWAEKTHAVPEITIKGRLAQGTIIKGLFSSLTTKKEYKNVKILEIPGSETEYTASTITIEPAFAS